MKYDLFENHDPSPLPSPLRGEGWVRGGTARGDTVMFILIIFLTLIVIPFIPEASASDEPAANVWIWDRDGNIRGTYSIGGDAWTLLTAPSGGGAVQIQYQMTGAAETLSGSINGIDTSGDTVIINNLNGSLQPPGSSFPQVSVVGLSKPVLSAENIPGAWISPPPGSFEETIYVSIRGIPALSGNDVLTLHWRINGGTEQSVSSAEAGFFLVRDGAYTVEYWASQGRVVSARRVATFTLVVPAGTTRDEWLRRDTDGDGMPDLWEVEKGLNPLENDSLADSDEDGWSDFDEIIRGADPKDPNSMPSDADRDGWSDFDERLRGTNPYDPVLVDTDSDGVSEAVRSPYDPANPPVFVDSNNDGTPDRAVYKDRPVATRLCEVEYLVSGGIFQDTGLTVPQRDMGDLTVLDIYWRTLFDQAGLPDAAMLSAAGLIEDAIPLRYRAGLFADALGQGRFNSEGLLPILRIVAGTPSIIRSRHLDASGNGDRWVAKGWVDASEDAGFSGLQVYLTATGRTWSTPSEWEELYLDYLRSTLVQHRQVDLSPESGHGIALLESLVSWYAGPSEGLILLGNPASPRPADAVNAVTGALHDRTLNQLHEELYSITMAGEALEDFGNTVFGYYADTNSFTESTTTRAAARLAQGRVQMGSGGIVLGRASALTGEPMGNEDTQVGRLARYIARLLLIISKEEIDTLDATSRSRLMNPDADYDGDGLSNAEELSGTPYRVTRPDNPDSDGDGRNDRVDPCPLDIQNGCIDYTDFQEDTDGDGIADPLDNCPNTENPDQADADGDKIGDACGNDYDGDGYANDEEIDTMSDPFNYYSIPKTTYLRLRKGFNLISFPAETVSFADLFNLMEQIGGNLVISRARIFDPVYQNFDEVGYDDAGMLYGLNRTFRSGEGLGGLIIYARQDISFSFPSAYCPPLDMYIGMNIIGTPCVSPGMTAFRILQAIGDETVVSSIQRYSTATGKFETAVYHNGVPAGMDFPIASGEGYFVMMKREVHGFRP